MTLSPAMVKARANLSKTFSNRDLPHHLTDGGIEHARRLALLLASARSTSCGAARYLARLRQPLSSEERSGCRISVPRIEGVRRGQV
jgi:hypothetical protein